jgi:hypothetical protein
MNCEKIVESYLLNKSPLNHFKYLIALFGSIIMFIYVINIYNFNQYTEQIIIPLLTFIVILIIIDILTKLMINKVEKDRLIKQCQLWLNDPNTQKNPRFHNNGLLFINMLAVENYNGIIEGFESNENIQSSPDMIENNNIVIDINKENEDKTQTHFIKNESPKPKPKPYNNNIDVNHILESGDSLLRNKAPFGIESSDVNQKESCLFDTTCDSICSTKNMKAPCVAPIPGPQWQPQSAHSVQQRLKTEKYTKNSCI